LRRKLEVLKNFDSSSLRQKEDESVTQKDDELIRKAPNGRLIMFKSNFDFLEKPPNVILEEESKTLPTSVNVFDATKGKKPVSAKAQINQMFIQKHRAMR